MLPAYSVRAREKKKKKSTPTASRNTERSLFFFFLSGSRAGKPSALDDRVGGWVVSIGPWWGLIQYSALYFTSAQRIVGLGGRGGADKATWLIITKLSAVLAVQCAMAAIIN